jgi:hypothetical protein
MKTRRNKSVVATLVIATLLLYFICPPIQALAQSLAKPSDVQEWRTQELPGSEIHPLVWVGLGVAVVALIAVLVVNSQSDTAKVHSDSLKASLHSSPSGLLLDDRNRYDVGESNSSDVNEKWSGRSSDEMFFGMMRRSDCVFGKKEFVRTAARSF